MASIRQKSRADGTVGYHVQIRLKGTPPVTETFDRKTDAKRWAEQTETAIRERRFGKVHEARRHTLAEAIDRFERDVLPLRPKQRRDLKSHLAWWRAVQTAASTLRGLARRPALAQSATVCPRM